MKEKASKIVVHGVPDARFPYGFRQELWAVKLEAKGGPALLLAALEVEAFTCAKFPMGTLRGTTLAELDTQFRMPGLGAAMVDVELLLEDGNDLVWRDWNRRQPYAAGARKRALKSSRGGKALANKRKGERPEHARGMPGARKNPARAVPLSSPVLSSPDPDPDPDPVLSSPVLPNDDDSSGLGAVCREWENRQKTPLVGKPLLVVEELLALGFSEPHVIAAFHAAADAVQDGKATSLCGAWRTIAEESPEGGDYSWGRAAVPNQRGMSAQDLAALARRQHANESPEAHAGALALEAKSS